MKYRITIIRDAGGDSFPEARNLIANGALQASRIASAIVFAFGEYASFETIMDRQCTRQTWTDSLRKLRVEIERA